VRAKSRYAKVFPLVTFQFPLRTTPEGLNHDHGSNTYDHQISRNVTTTQCPEPSTCWGR